MGDRDAVLHLLEFLEKRWDYKCYNILGQAFKATRDQRCLTTFFLNCEERGEIALDAQQLRFQQVLVLL
eukprot:SAG31_NODE_13976_length_834_cov_0.602721_1_plen_69_part_00